MSEHDQALGQLQALVADALAAANRVVGFGRSPWAGALLSSAKRLEFDCRWYELDVLRRDLDAAALAPPKTLYDVNTDWATQPTAIEG